MPERKMTIWEVFEEYADVRDAFEELLSSFEYLQDVMQTATEGIRGDLDSIRERLDKCDNVFRRYKIPEKEMPF